MKQISSEILKDLDETQVDDVTAKIEILKKKAEQ